MEYILFLGVVLLGGIWLQKTLLKPYHKIMIYVWLSLLTVVILQFWGAPYRVYRLIGDFWGLF